MRQIIDFVRRWLDAVAAAVMISADRLVAPALVRFIEEEHGHFSVRQTNRGGPVAGRDAQVKFTDGRLDQGTEHIEQMLQRCRAELVLRADRFVFRPLELPARASEFLDGIVRSQIDRLTPWQPSEAAFGWTAPLDVGNGKILVTIAATARNLVAPFIKALTAAGASSVSVSTVNPEGTSGTAVIKVSENHDSDTPDFPRIRRTVSAVLGITAAAAVVLFLCDLVVAHYSNAQQEELTQKITQRRGAIRAASQSAGAPATGYPALERRKQTSPSAVIVLEALSKLLPDNTYLTEVQLESDKLRLTGITREAPSLIRLIEESPHFSRASFFAPTTGLPNEGGERFHIETHARPTFSLP
jgi:general secretion pathway protein L